MAIGDNLLWGAPGKGVSAQNGPVKGENWCLWSCNICFIVLWQMFLLQLLHGLEKVIFYNMVHFLIQIYGKWSYTITAWS